MLDRVTITGADNSIKPAELIALTKRFPFVEWGILVSARHIEQGKIRFPSAAWIDELKCIPNSMNLSLHICGRWVRDLLLGFNAIPVWVPDGFQRIQLNFHGGVSDIAGEPFADALVKTFGSRQIIFQSDGFNGATNLELAQKSGASNCVPLFDLSGGTGVLPDAWPRPEQRLYTGGPWCYHGYAGGLGPDNLAEQLPLILTAAEDARIWIDMETHVRSDGDTLFDLNKVEYCLGIAEQFINR